MLRAYTGQDFGYDPFAPEEERAAAQASWLEWFDERAERLRWNPSSRLFEEAP